MYRARSNGHCYQERDGGMVCAYEKHSPMCDARETGGNMPVYQSCGAGGGEEHQHLPPICLECKTMLLYWKVGCNLLKEPGWNFRRVVQYAYDHWADRYVLTFKMLRRQIRRWLCVPTPPGSGPSNERIQELYGPSGNRACYNLISTVNCVRHRYLNSRKY